MKTALLQLNSSDDPVQNLATTRAMVSDAAHAGAKFVLTPEVTNCVSGSRSHQNTVLQHEEDDITLAGLRAAAEQHGIWVLIGSLGIKTHDADGRFANRSYLIDPAGQITARYDKIHMFDVDVTPEETYRESDGYRPGDKAVLAQTDFGIIGMAICYDVRFPKLFNTLADSGANILTIPAAFSPVTGAAHWISLLRARAIENGCYVLAPAQCGTHTVTRGRVRKTYGHSVAISPWGEIIFEADDTPGIHFCDVDVKTVAQARARVPSLQNARTFTGP